MTGPELTREERRAALLEERRAERRRMSSLDYHREQRRRDRTKKAAFAVVVVGVLSGGIYFAAGDLLGQRGTATTADAIPVRLSMAGFTPGEVRVRAGEEIALELWTTDTAAHLDGGVHTMISEELGVYEELPAAGMTGESRRIVQLAALDPGSYDIYCDTCCGGKDSPTMHGRIVVEA